MQFYPAEQYQAACHEMFERYERDIKKLLLNARVEHVGASSIPLAVSKGDLDIFVGVESNELEGAVERLTTLGFKEKLDTLRTPELCMLESISSEDVALQVVANGSEFECFLAFRDKLCMNRTLVQQYNALKMHCEGWPQDQYREKKSAFIEYVLGLE
ncbi:GrpB family protein [Vibrio chagasii]|uniref:GrpB family protein n=1 Tax=Vibrio chagasii TaxID=170679 RepID=A0A7V7THN9_9VIBR|nr:GrpB family protein [Vibrio chagasii]KAB0481888.1 GrpB family protein [Vibrio chagasii]